MRLDELAFYTPGFFHSSIPREADWPSESFACSLLLLQTCWEEDDVALQDLFDCDSLSLPISGV